MNPDDDNDDDEKCTQCESLCYYKIMKVGTEVWQCLPGVKNNSRFRPLKTIG